MYGGGAEEMIRCLLMFVCIYGRGMHRGEALGRSFIHSASCVVPPQRGAAMFLSCVCTGETAATAGKSPATPRPQEKPAENG